MGGICVAFGLIHLLIGLRFRQPSAELFFALASAGVAGSIFWQPSVYHATTVETIRVAMKWMIGFEFLFWFAAVWFIYLLTGSRLRRLAWIITLFWGVSFIIHLINPAGVLFQRITDIKRAILPWGELIVLPVGTAAPWRILSDIGLLLFFWLSFEGCRRLLRSGERRRAVSLGCGLALLLAGNIQATLVDLGILNVPYLMTYAFFGMILSAGIDFAAQVRKAGVLAQEVAAQESRWRSLLENVQLLVIGLDRHARVYYVNPHFSRVTGFDADEVLKEDLLKILPEEDYERVVARLKKGEIVPHRQSDLLTKEGGTRTIAWSNVKLRSNEDEFLGTMSIGVDVTDKLKAESELMKAYEEVRILKERLEDENVYLREQIVSEAGFGDIIGRSDAMIYVLTRIEAVAPTRASILLEGETGVGKELLARAVHSRSPRKERPMVKVDCSTLPPELLESELFGHERGAFTGADRRRRGRFELADGGTVFLDEIGELPIDLQPKLLRILEDGEFERLGGETTRKVDVRIIAATNRTLKEEVKAGKFRGDLYYRLSSFPISVPPLRQRRADIPDLALAFAHRFAEQHGKEITAISKSELDKLGEYEWPGNVRELKNVIERAVITAQGPSLRLGIEKQAPSTPPGDSKELLTMAEMEKRHILAALKSSSGKISGAEGAATVLGLNPNTLRSRMQKLGIKKQQWVMPADHEIS
jgi:PAS domain S-box-containing protein